jgi:hypothetical protein
LDKEKITDSNEIWLRLWQTDEAISIRNMLGKQRKGKENKRIRKQQLERLEMAEIIIRKFLQ